MYMSIYIWWGADKVPHRHAVAPVLLPFALLGPLAARISLDLRPNLKRQV
jgi:hypothetical protein